VRIGDVARVELGAENYNFRGRYNNHPASAFAIKLASGANALQTVADVKTVITQIATQFPSDVKVAYPLDNSEFVKLSIEEVVHTLFEAIVLVFFVMFLFLQNWRATLIPTIAVPVVLLGAFAVLYYAGFTLNTLTLFGMVLAIGLLVDDAIVVVENVERLIHEDGLSPKEAALRSMDEISGALIGIGLVLTAVFLPMAFFGGSAGVIYRQFSLTIVISMILSVLVALILTPALCATILKAGDNMGQEHARPDAKGIVGLFDRFFAWFNRTFDKGRERYKDGVRKVDRNWKRSLVVYGLVVAGLAIVFVRLPGGFMPSEDQGFLFAQVTLPNGATLEQTEDTMNRVTDYFKTVEGNNVEGVYNAAGFGFVGQAQNVGLTFVRLKDWSVRKGAPTAPMPSRCGPMARSARSVAARSSPLVRPPCSNWAMPTVSTSSSRTPATSATTSCSKPATSCLPPPPRTRAWPWCVPTGSRISPRSSSTSTRTRPVRSGSTCPTSTIPSRPRWVAATSTTSWTVAASRRSMSRPTRARMTPDGMGTSMCGPATAPWRRSRPFRTGTGSSGRASLNATTASRRWKSWARPRRATARAKRCRPCRNWPASCPPGSAMNGPG
jgi:hypothetical protein